jgi:hypothetical protein
MSTVARTAHIARGRRLAMLGVVAVMLIGLGCTSAPPAPPDERSALLASGFKVVPATTQQQREHLQTLTSGRVTAWQRTGRIYYVYPDASRNQLYVGTKKEYDAFRQRAPSAASTLDRQNATDMSAYAKQDAAMRRADGDSVDPYAFWASFDDLGW